MLIADICFFAPSVWNNLPKELKSCTNLNTYKQKLRDTFSTKQDKKITISIFTTRLFSSQQLQMHLFFNFRLFYFYPILVYQCFQEPKWKCVILATN